MNQKQPSKRTEIVAEMIQRRLSQVIQQEICDPRLPTVLTINAVRVSRDLSHARVYFTFLEGDVDIVTKVLNRASGYLRTALARTSTLRTVPALHFVWDESIDYAQKLTQLIDRVNKPSDDTQV